MTIHHWTDEHGNEWMGNYNPEQERQEMEARQLEQYVEETPGLDFIKGLMIGIPIGLAMWALIICALVVIF